VILGGAVLSGISQKAPSSVDPRSRFADRLLTLALALGLALAASPPARSIDIPGTEGRAQMGGSLYGLGVVDTGGGPSQDPEGQIDFWLDGQVESWLRLYVAVQGDVGGPIVDGRFGLLNYEHAFQNTSPSLGFAEAFADVHLTDVDLRLGLQRFAWGRLDGLAPTDVLNPRSYHDPFVPDPEDNKVAIPALSVAFYPPDLPSLGLSQIRADLLYAPWTVPSRLPLTRERWFPTTTQLSSLFVPADQLPTAIRSLCPSGLGIPVDLRVANDAPARTLSAGAIGIRLGGTWKGSDVSLYHYSGPTNRPNAELVGDLVAVSLSGCPDLVADVAVRQTSSGIHMTGFSASTVLGAATLRAEAAFFQDQVYLGSANELVDDAIADLSDSAVTQIADELVASGRAALDLPELVVRRDSVEWGVGADYLWNGFFGLLQLNQTVLFESAPGLLIHNPSTQLTGLLRRAFLRDRLELELRGVYSLEEGDWLLFPRLSYLVSDALRVRVGFLGLGGPVNSVFGQFGSNDEFAFQVRYSF
jgi:hypothetical protein